MRANGLKVTNPEQLEQMLDLPADGRGLAWVAQHNPGQLLLVPGLHATSITAAAAGHQQALRHLHFTALAFAALGKRQPRAFGNYCSMYLPNGHEYVRDSDEGRQLCADYFKRHQHTTALLPAAAKESDPAALKWLLALCCVEEDRGVLADLMYTAASAGQLDTLRYLHASPWATAMTAQVSLAAHKHPACLSWLLEQDCPEHHDLVTDLIRAGNLDMLQWLLAHHKALGQLQNEAATLAAAESGNLQVLKWLQSISQPCSLDEYTCAAAAANSDLSMLQWLRAQGVPWNERTFYESARAGSIPLLQWLRIQQHPQFYWNMSCINGAIDRQDLPLMQWLRAQVPPTKWSGESVTSRAAAVGNVAILDWLIQNGCPWSSAMLYSNAVLHNHGHILEWLHAKHMPLPASLTPKLQGNVFGRLGCLSTPNLMFLGDIGWPLGVSLHRRLVQARKTFCTFHGLVRWCSSAVSGAGAQAAFDPHATDQHGQDLLVHLSLLPQELLARIAFAAGLQHGLSLAQDATSMLS